MLSPEPDNFLLIVHEYFIAGIGVAASSVHQPAPNRLPFPHKLAKYHGFPQIQRLKLSSLHYSRSCSYWTTLQFVNFKSGHHSGCLRWQESKNLVVLGHFLVEIRAFRLLLLKLRYQASNFVFKRLAILLR